jgi:hypothetical protein
MPGQTTPQLPQFFGSALVSTQLSPQRMKGAVHWKSQVPPPHTDLAFAGDAQTVPHLPQLEVALDISTHEPLQLVSAPQSVPQSPNLQTAPVPHSFVQLPQCWESELKSTHAPLQSL